MPNIVELHHLDAPELAVFARLTEPQLRSRMEPEKGIFIAETPKVVSLALEYQCEPVAFLMERRFLAGKGQEILSRCGNVPVYTGDRELLAQLTGYPLTRGVLCAMRRPTLRTVEEVCANAKRIAVLEGIVDSTNVGAVFRSAAALGMDAVLLTPTCCDPLCRRAVRVSMGTIFQMPWARIGTDPDQWPELGMARLRRMGFSTVAMALSPKAIPIDDPCLVKHEKLAVLLGTEGDGLSNTTIARCDQVAYIPMTHHVDSLNVAAASAVAFWQLRVRRKN